MLDDEERIKLIDTENMFDSISKFPEQIEEVIDKVQKFDLPGFNEFSPSKILILGMGGSAISGDLLSSWCSDKTKVVIDTVRSYNIPEMADENTIVFACSYSGNTEETLSAVSAAQKKGCKIIAITSGGKLEGFCEENSLPVVKIPTGYAPRAAVGFLFFPMVIILEKLNILTLNTELPDMLFDLKQLRENIKLEMPKQKNQAKRIALELSKGIPYVYGHSYLTVIAKRWKTQLNENAKVLAMFGEIPEMHHNEIVGWSGDNQDIAKRFIVVLFRSPDEHPRISKRLDLTKKMLSAIATKVLEVKAEGSNKLSRMITSMYLGDYVSVYLAILRELDPTPVVAIDRLKKLMED
jgi:glucose/mannose-6-phosphate isomerase